MATAEVGSAVENSIASVVEVTFAGDIDPPRSRRDCCAVRTCFPVSPGTTQLYFGGAAATWSRSKATAGNDCTGVVALGGLAQVTSPTRWRTARRPDDGGGRDLASSLGRPVASFVW